MASGKGEELDRYLTRLSAFGFSGTVLVASGNRMLLHRGYGLADATSGQPVTTATAFNIASLTKQFTAAGIMRLATLGQLSPRDSIGRFFPDVPEDKRGITLHHLLTHASGLPWDVIGQSDTLDRAEVVRQILSARTRSAPGERYGYSNAGYNLLASVVEKVSGRAFSEWIRDELLRPAGLSNTGFTQDPMSSFPCRATPRNEWQNNVGWWEWPRGWRHGAGDVVSTAGDLYRWHRALRNGALVSQDARTNLFTPHVQAGDSLSYGYGWFIGSSRAGARLVYHGGDNRSYHSEFRWFPDNDRVIVILTALSLYDESGNALGLHKRVLANAIERILDGESVSMPPAPRPADPSELRRYEGEYPLPAGGRYTISFNAGTLKIGADGQDAVDALLGLDEAARLQAAAVNARAAGVLEAIVARDRDRLEQLLANDEHWIIRHWLEDAAGFIEEHGPFHSMQLRGSKPLPWQSGLMRTVAMLRFGDHEFDFQFTWQDRGLYESLTDVGTPHAVILPIAPLGDGEFGTWDLVTSRGAGVRFVTGRDGRMDLIVRTEAGEVKAARR